MHLKLVSINLCAEIFCYVCNNFNETIEKERVALILTCLTKFHLLCVIYYLLSQLTSSSWSCIYCTCMCTYTYTQPNNVCVSVFCTVAGSYSESFLVNNYAKGKKTTTKIAYSVLLFTEM